MAGIIRVGISGWTYAPWRGKFYPSGLKHKEELGFASRALSSIEINGTFYALQRPESFLRWAEETPADFVFAVKAPRFITHIRRLRDVEIPVANFLASGLLRLGAKLGPVLWQLPPSLRFDADLIARFLALLPQDTAAAVRMGGHHVGRLAGRAWIETDAKRPMRHAIEIRHDSFAVPKFIELLRAHGVALVCADTVAWPRLMDVTADFVYCRLHGSEELYASGYDAKSLAQWASRVRAWAEGREPSRAERVIPRSGGKSGTRDVFVYFDNDVKVGAPFDAQSLALLLEKRSPRRRKTVS